MNTDLMVTWGFCHGCVGWKRICGTCGGPGRIGFWCCGNGPTTAAHLEPCGCQPL